MCPTKELPPSEAPDSRGQSEPWADRFIEVATVGRPHGIRGELVVWLINPTSDVLSPGRVFRCGAQGRSDLVVEGLRPTHREWLVKFEGVDDRDAAAALTNHKLAVRRSELPGAASGLVIQADLVGCRAEDRTGQTIGTVVGFFNNGAHEVCAVRRPEGTEVLIPFLAETLIDFDAAGLCAKLDIPEGIPGLEGES